MWNLCDMFPIKKCLEPAGASTPLFFNSALENTIRRVQVNQDRTKRTNYKENREALVVARKN